MPKKKSTDWDKVKKLYPNTPTKELAKQMKISNNTIYTIASRNNLKKNKLNTRGIIWTKKDIATLKKYYLYGLVIVMGHLPNRSKWAIINKYREVKGLRKKQ